MIVKCYVAMNEPVTLDILTPGCKSLLYLTHDDRFGLKSFVFILIIKVIILNGKSYPVSSLIYKPKIRPQHLCIWAMSLLLWWSHKSFHWWKVALMSNTCFRTQMLLLNFKARKPNLSARIPHFKEHSPSFISLIQMQVGYVWAIEIYQTVNILVQINGLNFTNFWNMIFNLIWNWPV